jgi:Enoyl-CoA hydratase/isomerase
MDYETVSYESDGHVTVLTYDRPEQRNAVSRRMNRELHHAWQRFRDDPEAFVLVITGEGEAFCAGWDLEDAAELGEGEPPDWDEFRTSILNTPGECGYTRRVDVSSSRWSRRSTAGRWRRDSRTPSSQTSGSSPRTPSSERSSAAGTSSPATG